MWPSLFLNHYCMAIPAIFSQNVLNLWAAHYNIADVLWCVFHSMVYFDQIFVITSLIVILVVILHHWHKRIPFIHIEALVDVNYRIGWLASILRVAQCCIMFTLASMFYIDKVVIFRRALVCVSVQSELSVANCSLTFPGCGKLGPFGHFSVSKLPRVKIMSYLIVIFILYLHIIFFGSI